MSSGLSIFPPFRLIDILRHLGSIFCFFRFFSVLCVWFYVFVNFTGLHLLLCLLNCVCLCHYSSLIPSLFICLIFLLYLSLPLTSLTHVSLVLHYSYTIFFSFYVFHLCYSIPISSARNTCVCLFVYLPLPVSLSPQLSFRRLQCHITRDLRT